MKATMPIGEWKQLSTQLFTPRTGGVTIHPFSLRQYVLDKASRREAIAQHARAANLAELYATPPVTRHELQAAAKQPRKRAIETWESEGGATQWKSPRAD